MKASANPSPRRAPLFRYLVGAAVLWTAAIGSSLVWNLASQRRQTLDMALVEARAAYEKDLVYTLWGIDQTESQTSPTGPPRALHPPAGNPTPSVSGEAASPPFMTCQLRRANEQSVLTTIRGLRPLCPENAPDEWEESALIALSQGTLEVTTLETRDGETRFRLLRPLTAEERCLGCHGEKVLREGDVIGGISVSVSLSPIRKAAQRTVSALTWAHGALWLVGLSGIALAGRRLQQHDRERERALGALVESEAIYRTLVENVDLGIALMDRDHTVVKMNSTMAKWFAIRPGDLKGHKCYLSFEHRDRICAHCPGVRAMGTAQPATAETEVLRADGVCFTAKIQAFPVPTPAGGVRGFIEVVEDISELKRAQEERRRFELKMQQAQKLESLGVLAGGIAHDFNNLLMGILGNADLALPKVDPKSPVREYLKRIDTAAQRAADLASQMLAYSGKGRFVIEPIDLSRLVDEMSHLLKTVVRKQAAIEYDLARDLPPTEGDATQIRQVVMNLITNASDATAAGGGLIVVTTGTMHADRSYLGGTYLDDGLLEGEYVYVEVTDTGCGMEPESLGRIFDPFFTTKQTGRGLGLAAALGIVRGHRGAIKVQSAPGRGSTFRVLLPVVRPKGDSIRSAKSQAGVSPAVPWHAAGTILVVDDEESIRGIAKRMLQESGFTVLTAADGREAVGLFRERSQEIDLVLLDMTMPRLSGEEAFREIRRIRSDAKVVLSSGFDAPADGPAGVAGFLQKPYKAQALLQKVREALQAGVTEEM